MSLAIGESSTEAIGASVRAEIEERVEKLRQRRLAEAEDACTCTVIEKILPGDQNARLSDPSCIVHSQSPFAVQTGGDHYAKLAIQPMQYALANGIPFAEGSVIKYVTRWRDKGGVEDLKKARHVLDMLIAHEEAKP